MSAIIWPEKQRTPYDQKSNTIFQYYRIDTNFSSKFNADCRGHRKPLFYFYFFGLTCSAPPIDNEFSLFSIHYWFRFLRMWRLQEFHFLNPLLAQHFLYRNFFFDARRIMFAPFQNNNKIFYSFLAFARLLCAVCLLRTVD